MKSIVIIFFAIMSMVTVNGQTLTERQKGLAACACLMAQGDLERLEPAVRMALDNGVTVNELKEAFSQLYAYTGFPRSLNALGVLNKVLNNRQPNWKEGKPWTRPSEWDDAKAAYELGKKNQTQVSGREFNYDFCPQDDYYLKAHLFGDIFAGDQLSHADREIVTVAALSGLNRVAPQLAAHKLGAVNMGNSQQLVDELCKWLDSEGYTLQSGFPKGVANETYAKFFIGNSYVAPIKPANLTEGEATVMPIVNVSFEPGCRNNWHIHHGARQILICVSGKGWYQEWGKAPVALSPGMVIDIPEGVKHWHGAQKDSWFQHYTTHVKTGGEESNEWLEAVSDEHYSLIHNNL
ncbi:MAG: carboxymuconolactone decarboxylase family protein [Bacteroidales bacterium]|nr:carboxymuconolactone decarboxylase family protein [Bacteroidales bacterium]